jgi:transcriptional regulator with XRE-family HTH domain
MGFKENLKGELTYQNILVKELAARSGINLHTINNYLNIRSRIPSAEAAVKIARTLGVSVEYLVTGQETKSSASLASLEPETRSLIQVAGELPTAERHTVLQFAKFLKSQEKKT